MHDGTDVSRKDRPRFRTGPAETLVCGLVAALAFALGFPAEAARFQQSRPASESFESTARALADAAIRGDADGVAAVRRAIADDADAGPNRLEAAYLLSMADYFMFMQDVVGGNQWDPQAAGKTLRAVAERLAAPPEQQSPPARWTALRAVTIQGAAVLGAPESRQPALDEAAALMEQVGADEQLGLDARSLRILYTLQANDMSAAERVEALFPDHVTRLNGSPEPHERLVSTLLAAVHVRIKFLMGSDPNAAADAVHRALDAEPESALLKSLATSVESAVEAIGDGLEPVPASRIKHLQWTVIATDDADDGANEGVHDARELAAAPSSDGTILWFRIALHNELDTKRFGVNLVIGGAEEDSVPWWGTNSDFRFTRLITLWLAASEDQPHKYAGHVGLSDPAGVRSGDFGSIQRGGVQFALLPDENAIVVGAPASWFGRPGTTARIVGAVGTNQAWNDDIPDQGAASVTIPPRESAQ